MNTILGGDMVYNSPSRFLTRMVDKIPFIETKEESNILFQAEYAKLIPGRARSITKGERGVSYIDDFEAAETPFDMRMSTNWKLASFPQKQPDLFPEWQDPDRMNWLRNRSLMAWYSIDPTFFRNDRFTPQHIKDDIEMQSNHYMREVTIREVYPNKQLQQGVPNILTTLDMAFYPKSRGPYNYSASSLDFSPDGLFTNPSKTWGGIMRRIETNDFEAANIDYIEIWMMDPYVYNPNSSNTGTLYINLGNISEDILPDRRKSFENGFPKDGNQATVDESQFGRVPTLPQINNAFDNEPATRPFQDLGIDGLNDEEERAFYQEIFLDSLAAAFGTNSPIYQSAFQDPSNDNYLHNREDIYTNQEMNILNRYKRFNGMQGNSTLDQLSDGSGPKAATTLPDVEDINNDFTMNQTEDYFQYKIEISPSGLQVGQNYVADITEADVTLANGQMEQVKWYQLKIPIREYEKAVGNISDFKSIRFMRMFMTGFDDSIVLRMAQFQLVRADWRRYTNSLKKPGIHIPGDPVDNTAFSVSTVNIEENGMRRPVNYVTPPGIPRVIDPITPGAIELNEQSVAINVCNLEPGDARGAFKTMNLDIRNYRYLKMFLHIDPTESGDVQDNEMEAFIRLGTDLVGNYYEYAIPLVLSPAPTGVGGTYRPEEVWPEINNMDFELEEFYKAKQERENAGTPQTRPFIRQAGVANNAKVTLIGLPDLSNVRVIMIGVRNISDRNLCAEVWYNELRVTDIANKGGWAANARLVAQLADFSTINLTGSIRTIGFGGIDQRLNQRSLHDHYQYDMSSNIELGKFFPSSAGITIPMFINKNESIIQPKFNPLNPDIELRTTLSLADDIEERNAIRRAAEDYTSKYSINFVNVRKNRTTGKKAMPWDIENFNASYSYQNLFRRNQQIEEQIQKTYRGSLGYNFTYQPKPWEPLRKRIKNKNLDILRDFNFYPMPQTFNVRFDADRYYSELKNRSNDLFQAETPRLFDKNFTMTRFYSFQWNLTKNLKLDYQSTANARIEEPIGRLDTEEKMDSVKREFFNLGQMTHFNQTANLSYTVPLNKIKFLNWITLTARYSGNFGWEQAPPAFPDIGNTIQNSQVLNLNTQLNLLTFYNKFKVLRKINTPARSIGQRPGAPGRPQPGKKEEDEKKKEKDISPAVKNILRSVMMLKNISFSYTENNGTVLPGFRHTPEYMGHNFSESSPGFDFIFGMQDPDLRYRMAQNGSLNRDVNQFNFYMETSSRVYNGKATIEPIKDMRIDLDFNLNVSTTIQSTFRFDTTDRFNSFRDLDVAESGMFTMSHIFWRTAFTKDNADKSSPVFQQFENNRFVIAGRLQNEDERIENKTTDTLTNYPIGYSKMQQDVLISSFVAAYTGSNQQNSRLSPFRNFPLPNWRINYNGLSKIESLKKIFTNISLSHSYKGTYTVAGYQNNQEYLDNPNQAPVMGRDMFTQYQFQGISIVENFGPLAGVNVTLKNNWNIRTEYRKSRTINLNLAGGNVSENSRSEITIGGGYRANDILLPIKYRGKRILLENDLNFNMDFSIMDNIMIVRRLDDPVNEPVSGSLMISIKPTLDYMVNERINISLFLDHRTNKPRTSQAFPTALTDFGIRMRYTLQ
jgi:cell surface protein SprA